MSRADYVKCVNCGHVAYDHEHPDSKDKDRPRVFGKCTFNHCKCAGCTKMMVHPCECQKFIWP